MLKMNKIEKLIKEMCPNGVEYKKINEVVFKNSFKQCDANLINSIKCENGDVKLLPSSNNYD